MKNGFSLIEFLIIFGVLTIVFLLSITAFSTLTKKSDLDATHDNIVSIFNLARNRTLASEQASRYGIYFDTSTSPDQYVLFKGDNYLLRDPVFDEIHILPSNIEISQISFNGSTNEVVFNRLDGNTFNFGSIAIHSIRTNEIRDIYIYSSGEISNYPPSVPGGGRIVDSRHVHFDLGWSMAGATTLKFNFVNASRIEQISMSDFFSPTGFDWEGEFLINNVVQHFIIHTHQLDPVTILCIHRDRNEGKNNEEVYVYIIQDGTEKEIAHYDDDQLATVNKGIYVWNQMEIQ